MSVNASPPGSHSRTSEAIRSELLKTVDPKAPDERLLAELAASAAAIAFQVSIAAERLALLLPETLAEPKRASMIARTLHDMVLVGNVLARRVESTLSTAATLRIQRRIHRADRND